MSAAVHHGDEQRLDAAHDAFWDLPRRTRIRVLTVDGLRCFWRVFGEIGGAILTPLHRPWLWLPERHLASLDRHNAILARYIADEPWPQPECERRTAELDDAWLASRLPDRMYACLREVGVAEAWGEVWYPLKNRLRGAR